MAVQFRLKELIAERERKTGQRVTYRNIRDETGISTSVLHKVATNKQKMISLTVIDRLCNYFGCQVGDLMVREPDKRLT
jgi:putative transcriptional regulator